MAKKPMMTWNAKAKRWFKKVKGKMYAVSCKQLGCPESKEASLSAANDWWEKKLAEIEAAPPTEQDRRANAFKVWGMVQDWEHLDEESRERLVDSLIGAGQYRKIREQAERIAAPAAPEPDRAVKAQVEGWLAVLRAAAQSGQMSHGRYDGYCRNIGKFAEWVGESSAVDGIDEAKLEGYFTHLSVQVAAGKYSPNYAHTLLMTAKQFIARLAEMKLIALPGNIRSRRMRFNHSVAAKVEVFTVEEVRAMLAACDGFSEKTKLYLLLMLNCGMYQNDVAELRREEVGWKEGTITRQRSKTRERGGQAVTYKLWPETLELLKKHRSKGGDLVLTTDEGRPLVRQWIEGETARRYDCIQSAWTRLAAKMGLKKIRLGMKHLRKTAATLLGQHAQYKFFVDYFLAHAPKDMSQKHYLVPNDGEFFEALGWLRGRFFPEGG